MSARTIDQHREAVAALLAPLFQNRAAEVLPLSSARLTGDPDSYRDRSLAIAVDSPVALPPFDNSQMDGYAVRAGDLAAASELTPTSLTVAGRIAAGDPAGQLAPGTAAPIMTGAPIPAGADAVVPIEQADPPRFQPQDPDGMSPVVQSVSFRAAVPVGVFVRPTGSDVNPGDRLLDAGTRLGPAQYGVLAGTGLTSVSVLRRVRVLLIATGHEIREPGENLAAGQIYDSNSVILGQALRDAGCTVTARPCRSDDAADLLALLAEAPEVDLVVTVGGVSAGAREVVRDALGPLGVTFQHVAMQPGGPQGLGAIAVPINTVPSTTVPSTTVPIHTVPVITFPGNPVSALISFEVFLRPVLRRLAGLARPDRELRSAPLSAPVESPAGKHQLRRGILRPDGTLELVGGASSHLLHAYTTATVLVHLPVGVGSVAAGEPVDYWSIDD
ncbi:MULTISPECIES: gephyrin-like molybdotransferase Glp [Cryobacterium]|uniref:molybdopterin molybdotransferase MoeA n=1 Tax=Cryobacterium TaxID=69578 RepID=UPI000CD42B20|nr:MULTISPECIES: gephyrin-like molybdotransferase Glp [Cryobacterium]POH67994.1 molybdopterin molybdenumtransferase MoeA [Cryobacterium zongtaii]TFC47999.1 molybdopterin molybdotransferase MoeA [Cryobacterium sp. TMN-39-2]